MWLTVALLAIQALDAASTTVVTVHWDEVKVRTSTAATVEVDVM
jgi:hypothetical protein